MTDAVSQHLNKDIQPTIESKYGSEASAVAKLLETDSDTAVMRLQVDSHMQPHEFHAFMKEVQSAYSKDKSANPDLPNVIFADDKTNGIKVGVDKPGEKEVPIVFQMSPEKLSKRAESDKPIPMTGELLGLTKEQTKQILDVQKQEKASHEQDPKAVVHKFGDIAVSLKFKTPEEVNGALDKQDHLKAAQVAADLSKGMPLDKGEGYFQMLQRTHPELSDQAAAKLAHTLKTLNHNRTNLHVGTELNVMSKKEESSLEASIYADLQKKTGHVSAKYGQPLDK